MLLVYIVLLTGSFIFTLLDLFKKVRFRGYAIPARVCYGLSLVTLIVIAMRAWYVSSILTVMVIVAALFLIGLMETGFRNKLQNRMSKQLIIVITVAFAVNLLLSGFLAMLKC